MKAHTTDCNYHNLSFVIFVSSAINYFLWYATDYITHFVLWIDILHSSIKDFLQSILPGRPTSVILLCSYTFIPDEVRATCNESPTNHYNNMSISHFIYFWTIHHAIISLTGLNLQQIDFLTRRVFKKEKIASECVFAFKDIFNFILKIKWQLCIGFFWGSDSRTSTLLIRP